MVNVIDLTKVLCILTDLTPILNLFKSRKWGNASYTLYSVIGHFVLMSLCGWQVDGRRFLWFLPVVGGKSQNRNFTLNTAFKYCVALPCILSPVHHVLDLVSVCDKIDAHQSSVTVGGVERLETVAKVALYSQTCQATAQVLHTIFTV